MDTAETLKERGTTHGDFSTNAQVSQLICEAMRSGPSWEYLAAPEREALEMIAHKIARIVSGAPCVDHWRDVLGYAELAKQTVSTREGAIDVVVRKIKFSGGEWVEQ